MAGLVFLNVQQQDAMLMIGKPVDWQPRENRALMYDRHTDTASIFVPFVAPDGDVS